MSWTGLAALPFLFLFFGAPEPAGAAGCTPVSATLCVGADDIADVWINGVCVATCPAPPGGDFAYVPASSAQPVPCIPVSLSLLSPTGDNAIAVEVINLQPVEMWGTWVLTISCAGGGISTVTSSAHYDLYHDPSGSLPPPVVGGLDWTSPYYVEPTPWATPVAVTNQVYGKQAVDPQTGLALPPQDYDAQGDGLGDDILYFRQSLPTATATVTPDYSPTISPTFSLTATVTPTRTATLTNTQTPTFTDSPTSTPSGTISPTFTVSPTFSPSPTVTRTTTPFSFTGLIQSLGVYPDPFQSQVWVAFVLQSPTALKLSVYNVAGELVATRTQAGGLGVGQMGWNGTNNAGAACASGVYLLRVDTQGATVNQGFWARAALVH